MTEKGSSTTNAMQDSWQRTETNWPKGSNVTNDDIMTYYESWDNYEEDMNTLGYRGADVISEYVDKLGMNKDATIIDIGCGSGLVGRKLKGFGYKHLIGHDGSAQMLEQAKSNDSYDKYIECMLGNDKKLPIDDGVCDAVITAGGMSPRHFQMDAFIDMFRVIKPGGYFVQVCRDAHFSNDQFSAFEDMLTQEAIKGNFSILTNEKFESYYINTIGTQIPGRLQAFQKK